MCVCASVNPSMGSVGLGNNSYSSQECQHHALTSLLAWRLYGMIIAGEARTNTYQYEMCCTQAKFRVPLASYLQPTTTLGCLDSTMALSGARDTITMVS